MQPGTPLISVCMVTYNHERFIDQAVQSVLGQTCADLELVIVDDGSTDGTPRAVAGHGDGRIVSIRQENAGPGAAANRALATARGRYVALMTGDDVCHPDRLARQLAAYERGGPRLLFSGIDFIDDDGAPCPTGHYAEGLFDITPQTRAQIFRRFFRRGNFINAVTLFTERRLFAEAGPYDPLLFQMQDFEMWIRMVKRHDIHFLPEPLLSYRIRGGHQNLSSPTAAHALRSNNEYLFIMRRFFDDTPAELFREAFHDELIHPDCPTPADVACEQAFLFLASSQPAQRLIGLERLYALMASPETAAVLDRAYGVTPLRFVELLQEIDTLGQFGPQMTTLYVDTGTGFTENQAHRRQINPARRSFSVTFGLDRATPVCKLRWDPIEFRHCRVRLTEVSWTDRQGRAGTLDPATFQSSGVRGPDGTFSFETCDPAFFIPVEGELTALTIRGEWEVADVFASYLKTEIRLEELQRQLAARDQQMYDMTNQLQLRYREVYSLKGQLNDMKGQMQLLTQQYEAVSDYARRCERERQELINSRTWRWLSAIRVLARGARACLWR